MCTAVLPSTNLHCGALGALGTVRTSGNDNGVEDVMFITMHPCNTKPGGKKTYFLIYKIYLLKTHLIMMTTFLDKTRKDCLHKHMLAISPIIGQSGGGVLKIQHTRCPIGPIFKLVQDLGMVNEYQSLKKMCHLL